MNPIIVVALQRLTIAAFSLTLSGCYYMQAASGQMEINRKREPIDEVLAAESTPEQLASQLQLVVQARQFSIDELGLPDNGSYRSYADLERDYVVWNIVAVPEFSLQARTWCYPVVGCVSYRGYFSYDKAANLAGKLRGDGFDVALGGVAAYSTLGRFDDPILNTMTHWGEDDLVAVMFHELAHQVLYVKDDTEFNESFATAVEEIGMERWLASRQQSDKLAAWRARRALRAEFTQLVALLRNELDVLYSSSLPAEEMRPKKRALLEQFAETSQQLYADASQNPPRWLDTELNNARLVSTTLYHGRLQEFRDLLDDCSGEMTCFYNAATRLSEST
ncbi:MAG: aminopeptidase [Woeseiaceae bacterium]